MTLLLACTAAPTDSVLESDTDTDADSDADTDADTDADSDTDVGEWFLFTTRLDAGVRDGQLVDHAAGHLTLSVDFYAPGEDDPGCTGHYDVADQVAEGHRWTLALTYRDGHCFAASNLDPTSDVDRLIVGVEPLTPDLEKDLVDVFGDAWDDDYEPFLHGAHIGVDSTREIGWAWILEVDEDMALVSGDNCAVPGRSCLTELGDRAVLRTEHYYKVFAADFE